MDFTLSDEQVMLREGARRFLAEHCSTDRVREMVETEAGYDPVLWKAMSEQGWPAMHIPEEYGGAGFTYAESAILLHEMGRALAPVPFLSSAILAAEAILFRSPWIAGWLGLFALANAVYFSLVEEPGLERRFGADYRAFKAHVPRWVPRLTPWDPPR